MKCGKLSFFLILSLGLAQSGGAAELPDPTPPFAVGTSGKHLVVSGERFRKITGDNIEMQCVGASPQFYFIRDNIRFGGIELLNGGKPISSKINPKELRWDWPEGSLKLVPQNDHTILVSLHASSSVKCSLYLKGEFFNGTEVVVGEKRIRIPEEIDEKASSRQLIAASTGTVSFLPDSDKRSFSVTTLPGTTGRLLWFRNSLRYEFGGNKNGEIRFVIDPGSNRAGSLPPDGRIGRRGPVDLWEMERCVFPDTQGRRNLLQNSSFEQGLLYLQFRCSIRGPLNPGTWKEKPITITEKEALFGKRALSMRSDSPQKRISQNITTMSSILEPGDYVFSVYAKSDRPEDQTLKITFLNPTAPYDIRGLSRKSFPLSGDWKRYELPVKLKEPGSVPVLLQVASSERAICLLDGMQLERGMIATKYEPAFAEATLLTSEPDNFLEYGGEIDAKLRITAAPNISGRVEISVRDFFDRKLYKNELNFQTGSDGEAILPLSFDTLPRGIFLLDLAYLLPDGRKRYETQRFSVVSSLDNSHRNKNLFADTYVEPLTPTQVYGDVLERYRKLGYGARSGFIINDSSLSRRIAEYGIDSLCARLVFSWRFWKEVEWYLFPGMTRKDSLLLDRFPIAEKRITAEYLQQAENAAAAIVARAPEIRVWSPMCEPDANYAVANPVYAPEQKFLDYIELECAVARGIKRGNPNALLATSTPCNITFPDRKEFLRRLIEETAKRGVRYDAVAAHIYRGAPEYPAPSLEDDFLSLCDILKQNGYPGNIPFYFPEGMHWLPLQCYTSFFIPDYFAQFKLDLFLPYTYDLAYGEKLGTALRARTWLLGLKYQDRIKSMNASNYGLFCMDGQLTPYMFQKVPNTLGRLLGDAVFRKEIKLSPDTRCYLFEDGEGRPVVALWACAPEYDRGRERGPEFFMHPIPNLTLFDLMEAEYPLRPGKDGLCRIPLSPFPVFLRGKKGSLDRVSTMLEAGTLKSRIPLRPSLLLHPAGKNGAFLSIENPYPGPMTGVIRYRDKESSFSIGSGKQYVWKLTPELSFPPNRQETRNVNFTLDVSIPETKQFRYEDSITWFSVPRRKAGITIDGDISDWADVAEQPVSRRIIGNTRRRNGPVPDASDLSAQYKVTWDEQRLYLLVTVTDDVFGAKERLRKREGWKNDSLQVFLNTYTTPRCLGATHAAEAVTWEYGFLSEDKKGEKNYAYRYTTPNIQLTRGVESHKSDSVADDVEMAVRMVPGGRIYEIAFPAEALLPFKLRTGEPLGLGILINDVDRNLTDLGDRSHLTNATGSDFPNRHPETWPILLLTE